jgi:hypothetical protein
MTYKPTRRLFFISAIAALTTLLLAGFAGPAFAVIIPPVPVGNAHNSHLPSTLVVLGLGAAACAAGGGVV